MSTNVNRVFLGGNLTRDPELKVTQSGTSYCRFGLAINEFYGKGEDRKEYTTFVNVVSFGRTGEVIHEYLSKGDPILITDGKLDFSEWTDAESGKRRTSLGVKCQGFQFVGGGRDDSTKSSDAAPSTPAQDVPF